MPLLFPSLSCHFLSMTHGKAVQEGGHQSWQVGQVWGSGLPGRVSDQPHVSLMGPIVVLPELRALLLLVQKSFFFPVGLPALALR